MKSVLFTFLLGFGICLSTDSFGFINESDTSGFVLVKESDGIALYERWYEIKPDLLAREVKATFTVKARTHAAVALIRDESRGTAWNKNTRIYKVVPENENTWYGYIEYDLPWPVSNQDCVLQYRRMDSPDALHVEFSETEHPLFPIRKKIDRIAEISGKWVFKESDGRLHVEYYVTTTPSTTLPPWVTDPIIRNNLLETLTAFREILEAPRVIKIAR